VRRSLALIAVAAAVAVAAVIVAVGMNSGGGEAAGASGGASAGTSGATSSLPSGHPSVAADQEQQAAEADASAGSNDPVALLEKRRAKDPTDVGVLLALGKAYFMRQRLQQAEQAYSDALALEPGSATAQVGLAMVWHAQGDSGRAETALLEVLDAHPDDQEAHYSLAIVYFSAGRVGDAKAQWETAARIDPASITGRRSQSFVNLLEDQQSSSPSAN
jgi:cytochrome c-type biogenesis protein CcmH/NrfG